MLTTKELSISLRAAGFDTFSEKNYSDPKRNAQRNLDGKTHYVDDDTLRYFGARILSTRDDDDGLIFCLIESAYLTHDKTRRGFRFVAFDIFGTVLERADLESTYRTRTAAQNAYRVWLESFATVGHYRQTLASMAEKAEKSAAAYRSISRECGE